jgi:hypothetical protein
LNEEGGPQQPSDSTQPPDEELRRQMEEQIKQLRIDDVLLQTVVTLVNLTGRKLTVEEEKDLQQAGTGIEAVRALLPLCPEDQVGPIKEALSQLQMLFARESQEPGRQVGGEGQEREKARSKLWTPPGTEQ